MNIFSFVGLNCNKYNTVQLFWVPFVIERRINFGFACINISFQDIHKLQIIMYSILFQNNVSPNCEKLIIKLHGGPRKKNISNLVMLPPKPLPILYTSFMNLNIITSYGMLYTPCSLWMSKFFQIQIVFNL